MIGPHIEAHLKAVGESPQPAALGRAGSLGKFILRTGLDRGTRREVSLLLGGSQDPTEGGVRLSIRPSQHLAEGSRSTPEQSGGDSRGSESVMVH